MFNQPGGQSVMRLMIVNPLHLLWDLSNIFKTVFYFQFINYIFSLFSGVEPPSVVPGAASQPESRQPAWHGLHVRGQGHRRLLRRCRGRLSTLPRLRPGLRIRGQYQHTNIISLHIIPSDVLLELCCKYQPVTMTIHPYSFPNLGETLFWHFRPPNNVIITSPVSRNGSDDCNLNLGITWWLDNT